MNDLSGGFKVSDVVEYTNEYGVKFAPRVITEIMDNPIDWLPERTIYINSDCHWMPVRPSSLRKLDIDLEAEKVRERWHRECRLYGASVD